MGLRGLAQTAQKRVRALQLVLRLFAVELGAGRAAVVADSSIGTEQQPGAGAHGSAVLGLELQTKAAGRKALVVALLAQGAQVQFTGAAVALGCAVGVQTEPALPGGVVKHELVVAASAALAGAQSLGLDARQYGVVGVAGQSAARPLSGLVAGKPHRGIAGGVGEQRCGVGQERTEHVAARGVWNQSRSGDVCIRPRRHRRIEIDAIAEDIDRHIERRIAGELELADPHTIQCEIIRCVGCVTAEITDDQAGVPGPVRYIERLGMAHVRHQYSRKGCSRHHQLLHRHSPSYPPRITPRRVSDRGSINLITGGYQIRLRTKSGLRSLKSAHARFKVVPGPIDGRPRRRRILAAL